ncbi:class I SAM-dependent methyltransferase [Streptomyces sp. TRM49041]|uniref:class I SAM-dependent methyltransferase n=1 Tax=Streptomyces sp. TRM49041 TaxID=2603216 RepID=UPI0011EEE849|nr:class I SAM-dependent methyltransferase [Streptomyces sp. TRM49041]
MTSDSHPDDDTFLHPTRAGYDAVAADYAEHFRTEFAGMKLGRAMLGAFAEYVRPGLPVADVGCGPGGVTAHLAGLGVDTFGIDLSPGMLTVARREHPDLRFERGTMTALDVPDGTLGGMVAWYSLIHVPPERVPAVLAEFHRVLTPGAPLLLAFQQGEGVLHLDEALGHAVSLDFHRWTVTRLAPLLAASGLPLHAHLLRDPEPHERTPSAYTLSLKPA